MVGVRTDVQFTAICNHISRSQWILHNGPVTNNLYKFCNLEQLPKSQNILKMLLWQFVQDQSMRHFSWQSASFWQPGNKNTRSGILPFPFSTILSSYTETVPKASLSGGVSITPATVRWCTPVSLSRQYPPSCSCPAMKHTTLLWERMMARSSSKFQARQMGSVDLGCTGRWPEPEIKHISVIWSGRPYRTTDDKFMIIYIYL